jgi:hypothetical protein
MALSLDLVTRPAGRLWRSYCNQLDRRPLLSRVATGVRQHAAEPQAACRQQSGGSVCVRC